MSDLDTDALKSFPVIWSLPLLPVLGLFPFLRFLCMTKSVINLSERQLHSMAVAESPSDNKPRLERA